VGSVTHQSVKDGPDRSKDLLGWVSWGRRHGLHSQYRAFIYSDRALTVYQLLREVRPVMIPEMAPRPMGRPTFALALDSSVQDRRRTCEDRVPCNIEEEVR
jgi:hypothetical protein